MTSEELKTRLPLRVVAAIVGISLPPDGRKFHSPFRPDNTPSCSVNGEFFSDWSRGEHLNSIGFFAAAKKISTAEAFRELTIVAGGAVGKPMQSPAFAQTSKPPPALTATKELLVAAAESRSLSWEAFEAARVCFKTLRIVSLFGHNCWVLFDAEGIGWEARRLDGKKFEALGTLGERKSHSKGRGLKSWPVGINPPGFTKAQLDKHNPRILLVEGGPDYIAACQLELELPHLVLPCAMLGKCSDISQSALPLFRGRDVTIAGHPDARSRVEAWGRQIKAAGARSVHPVLLGLGLDLNDHLRERPLQQEALRQLLKLK
jgi:hypothetical protein